MAGVGMEHKVLPQHRLVHAPVGRFVFVEPQRTERM